MSAIKNGDDSTATAPPSAASRLLRDRMALDAEETVSEAEQTASDTDQTASDSDQTAALVDQASSMTDQALSDRDQATADRDLGGELDTVARMAYEASRAEREGVSEERRAVQVGRRVASEDREATARKRDATAIQRDHRARARDAQAASLEASIAAIDASTAESFEMLREQAARDRAEAARDRARAAEDRREASRERSRLEAELLTAHIDGLTGAYRREMGRLVLSHEVDRARRGDGRFVIAFVDVDDLKGINDRDGHAAGDRALRTVVTTLRERLRSFDPILRYGGDEFVAGMGGTELADAELRFSSVQALLKQNAGIGISVGLAALDEDETADELVDRADRILIDRRHGARHEGRASA